MNHKRTSTLLMILALSLLLLPACAEDFPSADAVSVGDIVTFGRYEQDNDPDNGPEPIEWIVLAVDETIPCAMLVSKYGLDTVPYNEVWAEITWEDCTLRTWLNTEFAETAFDGDEHSRILYTLVDNGRTQGYPSFDTDGGNDTVDPVFLLSYWEMLVAFPQPRDAICAPTAYAAANGAFTYDGYQQDGHAAGWWWLRSPGYYQYTVIAVSTDGYLMRGYVHATHGIVRPALWVMLEPDR